MDSSTEHAREAHISFTLSGGAAGQLIEYLEKNYRTRLWTDLPSLVETIESISRDSTSYYPHLEEVLVHLRLLHNMLVEHMESEEAKLFYPIRRAEKEYSPIKDGDNLKQLVRLMEYEHELIKEGFLRIRHLCHGYHLSFNDAVLPELYERLRSCESLFLEQIKLEYELLFRRLLRKMDDRPETG
ncbi:hypothetical protein [Nafulsella turpanensis]|uniref:hypothetical protein n=1 Tax=Nafulsella turpanensis TaxID=1265690 RepID=UPI000375B04B|nr:hypothetical protein [Nafulsella turpanensis]